VDQLEPFLDNLPLSLRIELMNQIHKHTFKKHSLFIQCGGKNYINWISSELQAQLYVPGQMLYSREDEIDGFYFMIKGLAGLTLPERSGMMFGVIDPTHMLGWQEELQVFQFIGMEDTILNHINLMRAFKSRKLKTLLDQRGKALLSKRSFQVTCIREAECLTLSMEAIDKMKRDFQSASMRFFQRMLEQFMTIFCYH
jgi:CRP-like cAMP-binding protein